MVDTSILFEGGAVLAVLGAALFGARKFLLQRSEMELDEIGTKYFNEVLITETKNLAEDVSRGNIEKYKSYLDRWYDLKNNRKSLNNVLMGIFILFMSTIGYLVLLALDMLPADYLVFFFSLYFVFIYILISNSKQIRDTVDEMNDDLSYLK